LDTLEPIPTVQGHAAYGGLSGPAIKPVGLRAVSLMAKAGLLPVSGIGGISTWQDAAEYMLLGAGTVQVCTAVMWNGYGIIDKLVTGLSGYVTDKGFSSVSEMVGAANARVKGSIRDLETRSGLTARILAEDCKDCGKCIPACRDGGFYAISRGDTVPVVDPQACDGCGLCLVVCPFGAIELVR
jgi:dihydropyrimidine dehydrogenase (NAD+) subunit PreA